MPLSGQEKILLKLFLLQIAVFWAVWQWLAVRVWSSGEEVWGLVALAFAGFFCFKGNAGIPSKAENLRLLAVAFSSFFLLLYAVTFNFTPPLFRAFLAMTALNFILSAWRFGKLFHTGLFALLLLGLPLVASLNFFAGFPMRVIVGEAVEFLLRMQGLDVLREGVCLHFGEKLIWIDAPCSGVKMLWFGVFLAAVLVCFFQLRFVKSLAAFVSALAIILIGNVFRASALFYIESGIFQAPEWMHEAVGVSAFLMVSLCIIAVVNCLQKIENFPFEAAISLKNFSPGKRIIFPFFVIACAFAFFAPFIFTSESKNSRPVQNFPGFPSAFEGKPLREIGLSEREKFFLEDFPGKIGRFSDGQREIIVRWVTEATRKLHPAEDCFKAIGYETKPLPLKQDERGKRWACFSARKNAESLKVCERIYDDAGSEWTDVSAWYWFAIRQENGGWWAITTAERED